MAHVQIFLATLNRGYKYAEAYEYPKCVLLWKFALTMHIKGKKLKATCLDTVQTLIQMLWEMRDLHAEDPTSQPVDPKVFLEILDIMVGLLQELMQVPDLQVTGASPMETIKWMMQLCLHMMHLGVHLEDEKQLQKEQSHQLRCLVYQLVHLCSKTKDGQTLLHLAVDPNLHSVDMEYISTLPSVKVVKLLLERGADVNARDEDGNTPLYMCQFLTPHDDVADIPACLIEGGAHADVAGKNGGGKLVAFLRSSGFRLTPVQPLSLMCLSAKVMMKKNVPLQEDTPACLVEFVHMH